MIDLLLLNLSFNEWIKLTAVAHDWALNRRMISSTSSSYEHPWISTRARVQPSVRRSIHEEIIFMGLRLFPLGVDFPFCWVPWAPPWVPPVLTDICSEARALMSIVYAWISKPMKLKELLSSWDSTVIKFCFISKNLFVVRRSSRQILCGFSHNIHWCSFRFAKWDFSPFFFFFMS